MQAGTQHLCGAAVLCAFQTSWQYLLLRGTLHTQNQQQPVETRYCLQEPCRECQHRTTTKKNPVSRSYQETWYIMPWCMNSLLQGSWSSKLKEEKKNIYTRQDKNKREEERTQRGGGYRSWRPQFPSAVRQHLDLHGQNYEIDSEKCMWIPIQQEAIHPLSCVCDK